MTFEVGVVSHFSASHHLVGDFGPASEPHGHTYRVVATVRGSELRADGTLIDITVLQSGLQTALDALDGRDLNDLWEANPTAEVVARQIFDAVATALMGAELLSITVWESDEAYASYSATSRR